MNNIYKNSIFSALAMFAILALGVMANPAQSYARNCGEAGCNYVYSESNQPLVDKVNNPTPAINSLTPSTSNVGTGAKTITITGTGFIPSSVARVNGSSRPTTFIDHSHLMMQITGNDTFTYYNNGGFYITVFNPSPGGGYSNGIFFKINKVAGTGSTTSKNKGDNTNDTPDNFVDAVPGDNGENSNLVSNAIFGANGLFPSGLIQWILFAILVLLIVILVRKVYGADKRYETAPMKHK